MRQSECGWGNARRTMLKRLRNSFKRNRSRQAAHPPQSEDISLNDRGLVGKEEPLLSASGGSPGDDALYVREAAVIGIRNNSEQRSNAKRGMYLFHIQLTWSTGAVSHSCKSYRELFDFHCALLDMFPKEAGLVPESARSIPYLPGRSILRRSTLRLAQERLPEIHSYVQDLFRLPPELSRCEYVQAFFGSDSAEGEAVGLDSSEPSVVDRTNNHALVDVLPEEGVQFDNPAAI